MFQMPAPVFEFPPFRGCHCNLAYVETDMSSVVNKMECV